MDTSSRTLIIVVFVIMALSIGVTFVRYMVYKDYPVIEETQ